MRRVDGLAAAAGLAALTVCGLYLGLIAGEDTPGDAPAVALWAATIAACGVAGLVAAASGSPRLRYVLLAVATVVLAVAGTLAISSIGVPLLLTALVAGVAAVRTGAPDAATGWASVLAGLGLGAVFAAAALAVS